MAFLFIVESPGKVKKISSYLGRDYTVKASVGHIRDLKEDELSINVDGNFEPTYIVSKGKQAVVSELKNAAKDKKVIIATDADREGEGIAFHLIEALKLTEYQRVTFTEITQAAIKKAIAAPRTLDVNLVNAQQARRVADRLVGYILTPVVRHATGRVQSVAVRLLVDKESEIESSKQSKKIVVSADFFGTTFHPLDTFDTLSTACLFMQLVQRDQLFKVINVDNKERLVHPGAPFITSTLQQDAAKLLKLPIATTMKMAQTLYEKGHITYMRTDCPTLSPEAQKACLAQVEEMHGKDYMHPRTFHARAKNAQEAHEAIRPTHFEATSVSDVGAGEIALYQLIWKRTMASQMAPAKYADNKITVRNSLYATFEGTISNMLFDGWRVLFNGKDELTDVPKVDTIAEWTTITAGEQYDNPPSRYDEPSLVKKLEQLGIGRPSTYATIITKIQDHGYVEIKDMAGEQVDVELLTLKKGKSITRTTKKQSLGKEAKRMVPTPVAKQVTTFLKDKFATIIDLDFTSRLEQQLDDVAEGKVAWVNVIRALYGLLNTKVEKMPYQSTPRTPQAFPSLGMHPTLNVEMYYVTNKFGNAIRFFSAKYGKDIYVNLNNLGKKKPSKKAAITFCDKKLEWMANN